MSGDIEGLLVVPVVLCVAAPIVVTGLAIAGTAAAIGGAVKLGGAAFQAYHRQKEKKAKELEDSGLVPQLASAYRSLVAENSKIASVYNTQTLRVVKEMENRRGDWEKILQKNDVELQMDFQEKVTGLRKNLAEYEREKASALRREIQDVTDEQDRELNHALRNINAKIETDIQNLKAAMKNAVRESEAYAQEYHKSVKLLLKTLKEEYQGEKFCRKELAEIQELMDKSEEVLDTAPQAAYAIIWDAAEKTLLAINQAENMQQEWLMQYRCALVLAEEIKAVFTYENTLGYLVNGIYKQTREEAEAVCQEQGWNPADIRELAADEYVYGELADLKKEFDEMYRKLHEEESEISLEEMYTIIDDLNVKYGAHTRQLIFEAKMNLNEALLIDRVEKQLNDALGGGYHSTGSARGGNIHNGEKHILFERDGNPDEQICVVLKNGGWDDGEDGQAVLNTEVDLKVLKDNKISEKKRRQLRNRICDYLNASVDGAQTSMGCVKGTENQLTRDTSAGNLREVRRRRVAR